MKREVIIDKLSGERDISPSYAGFEKCESSYSFGPYARSTYLIHYCLSGRGTLYDRYGEHKVKAGELFIIRPGEITTYTADENNPWHYVWIGLSGKRAQIFSTDRSVYPCPEVVFRRLYNVIETGESCPDIYTSIVYEIIYNLFSENEKKQDALTKIQRYIRYNYMQAISVESVSRLFGYERTYLYRIFKKRYGYSIKEYIVKIRMEHAKSFLSEGYSVRKTALMTGYGDEFNFSRAYKKYYSTPPSRAARE